MVIYKGTSGNMTACAQDFEKRKIELTVHFFSGFILFLERLKWGESL